MRKPAIRLAIVPLFSSLVLALPACVEQEPDKPTAEDLTAAKQNLLSAPPTPKYVVNADLDGKIVFLGLDVDPLPVEAGKDVKLTQYWKVVSPPGDGWKTFMHVEGPGKQSYINGDHVPIDGKYPVNAWKAGDIIRDAHTIRMPDAWPYPVLEVYVGLWRGSTRMPIKSGAHDNEGRVLAASVPVRASTATEPRKRYVARMIDKAPKLDGKLDDPAWAAAPSTGPFVNTMTGAPVAPSMKTEAKLLWDKKNLYVGFDNTDDDVWTDLTKRDDKLWTEEADELMIDADGNGRTYIELQFAPNGNVFDTYLPSPRRYEDTVDPKLKPFSWNSKLTAKVHVDGTLNKRDDQDKGWTVEIAIPLEDVKGMDDKSAVRLPPEPGDVWRINMYRMDLPKGKPQQAAGWSPPLVGDFHALGRFGELVFADASGKVPAPAPPAGAPVAKAAATGPAAKVGGTAAPSAAPDRKLPAAAKGGDVHGKE
ncbi:MAG TPA: carbohydrate-binding family 9-like protein [Polyangia bacterium]|nr:carbohydrate-binding family 9-like protein [Polyangia bacterium]